MAETADLTIAGAAQWSGTTKRERNFWIALTCAAVLHASLFVGAIASKPERLGDPTGADKAISVSLVTEADLESRSTVADKPQPPPGPQAKPAQQPQPAKPPPPEKQQAKQEPQPQPPQPEVPPQKPEEQPAKAEQPPQPDDVKPDDKPEQKVAKAEDPKSPENAPDLLSLQDINPANMKSATKPKPSPKTDAKKSSAHKTPPKKKRMAALDLSTPKSLMQPSFGGGGAAGLQRPPGITRSGLNDAFARAVIKALQQTMPQLTEVLGRVTIRIFLTESGNVSEVRLLSGAKNSSLNQSVVFAARQTSYPIPPAGSNRADRTFMVTYIYD